MGSVSPASSESRDPPLPIYVRVCVCVSLSLSLSVSVSLSLSLSLPQEASESSRNEEVCGDDRLRRPGLEAVPLMHSSFHHVWSCNVLGDTVSALVH